VTLAAAIEAELPFLRAEAEGRMLDTFEIRTYDDDRVFVYNEDLDEEVENIFTVILTTPGRVKVQAGLAVRDAEVGGRTAASVVRSLHIPVDSIALPPNAVAVCTAVHATSDPTLLGARLVLSGPAPGSQTTARRLEVEEVLT
jgi:hypothetical protein